MDIKDIPSKVFDLISVQFGIKQERYNVRVGSCSRQDWKIQRVTTGQFIAYAEIKDSEAWQYNIFAIWELQGVEKICSETRIEYDDILTILDITAGSFPTGSCALGLGEEIKEDIQIRFPIEGISIGREIIGIMCEAVSEANTLAMSPECVRASFYERDKEEPIHSPL